MTSIYNRNSKGNCNQKVKAIVSQEKLKASTGCNKSKKKDASGSAYKSGTVKG